MDHRSFVQSIFTRSAVHYDRMNDWMSFGMHDQWKQIAVDRCPLYPNDNVLDLACGSGDITLKLHQSGPKSLRLYAADANQEMLHKGRNRLLDEGVSSVSYCLCHAEALPFANDFFHVIISAFGLRNFTNPQNALTEMYRSLRWGGHLRILEFSQADNPLVRNAYSIHAQYIIPWLAEHIAHDTKSYSYLTESIAAHPPKSTVCEWIRSCGFEAVRVHSILGGLIALYEGVKC